MNNPQGMHDSLQRMKEGTRKVVAVFLILAILLAFVGTILMFMTTSETRNSHWVSGSYSYYYGYTSGHLEYYYTTHDHPEAGAMPLVGTVLLIISLACWVKSKSREKMAIVATVFAFLSIVMLSASVAILEELSWVDYGYTGWYLCISAASLTFIMAITMIATYARRGSSAAAGGVSYGKNYLSFASELSDAKALLDGGIFTQEEYAREKARIFAGYGYGEGGAGATTFIPTTATATTAAATKANQTGDAKSFDPFDY